MDTLIKVDLNKFLKSEKPVILDLGCGRNKRDGSIGIDRENLPNVDIIADIEEGLKFFPDEFADKIYAFQCLEHIQNFENLLSEIVRVLKKDGKAVVQVPHFANPYYYSDPTHKRYFGFYTFDYFVESKHQINRRIVPDYYFPIKIIVLSKKIIFDSPYFFGKIFAHFWQIFFNLTTFFQERYEEHFCYMFPCNSIEVIFKKA